MGHRRHRHGFTLVELLVVIGIIAVLIAVIMPALQKARRSAVMLQCAGNMRQIGAAISAYAQENRGVLPFAAMKVTPPGGGTHASMWCLTWDDLIAEHLGAKMTTAEKEAAFNYRGIPSLVCPADPIATVFSTPNVQRRSYALVRAAGASKDGKPFRGVAGQWTVSSLAAYVPSLKYQIKVNQIRQPSETLMVVERANAWNAQGYEYESYVDVPGQVSQFVAFAGDVLTLEKSRQTFHGDRWNFLFVDGHVAYLKPKFGVTNTSEYELVRS
jgi:prepilin-type N-terminal cleavage/methylation domain-containing protein/prepilin-type processing-associated H-X9-DG protein